VAGCPTAELFEAIEELFDEVACCCDAIGKYSAIHVWWQKD